MAESRRLVDSEYYGDESNLGAYQRTNLDDIINNFIVAYIGDGKVLNKVPRHEVAFHAQRALQEFSYDVLRAEKHLEIEMNPDTLSIDLPSDYVDYVKISYLDDLGNDVPAYPSRINNYKQAPAQDENYNYLYDQNGDLIYSKGASTASTGRFQDPDLEFRDSTFAQTEYYNYYYDDDYSYYYNAYYGRRFGLNPEFTNQNAKFILDEACGKIFMDYTLAGGERTVFINLRYISDGLADNGDLSNTYIHKFAEDAIYSYLLYNLSKVRPSAAAGVGLYKKEASAKMRNAKLRLTRYNLEELTQIMRGKSKWIKH